MFRRKILPKRSWSVLATWESGGLSSSSTLSGFVRPITRSCSATGSDSHRAASWAHFFRSRIVPPAPGRSEEHTSELQSRLHLVCRLLLEKKKKTQTHPTLSNKQRQKTTCDN